MGSISCFEGGAEIRSVVAHNVHKNVGRVQEGGASMLLFGSLIQQFDVDHSGKDDTGLGRWCYMTFCGSEGIKTRVVCGYNPCYNKKKESNTSYQQHRQCFITKQKRQDVPKEALPRRSNCIVKALAGGWGSTNCLW